MQQSVMRQDKSQLAASIGLWLGPAWLLATLLLPAPAGMPEAAWHCTGMALLMATWWATEAIPIPVTSLLPIVLVPALGTGKLDATTANYAHPIIFLFLGGFLLGLAMQRWNLHRRIALNVLLVMGQRPERQIAGFMLATGFLSMWVSNTATSVMMLPIGMSVISLLGNDQDSAEADRYAAALLLSIAYAASIGGIATLIGTPPNALLAAYLSKNHDITIGFGEWMIIGLPVAAIMMALAWWWLTRGGFRLNIAHDGKQLLSSELRSLGGMTLAERLVSAVFVLAAAAWIASPGLADFGLSWLSDTVIAIIAGITLFLLPSGDREQPRLLRWEDAKNIPWGVLLLFGGGLALADIIKDSGLAAWIAQQLSGFSTLPILLLVGIIVFVIIFLTEVTSNTATAAAFLPLLGALAVSVGADPLLITVPAAIAASCAFMMPVATPPNAIVFATGQLKIQTMMRAGFFLNLAGTIVLTLVVVALLRAFWI
ncbi:DASS family sodium-coupled anion symporter [Noviherbaspirillum sp. CPCC 100848]|uniref:DASS family sodium-coupled anion symporter n=1 Tax=Noviherbaspirillum album TaxID=3080276 RepID=A0ABU6JKB7_9BURK|nr:DASS family sodium-coupled anion symporter [Noviherbaspirillum sp. CPCC 100848]MEC4723569.1 DASS family sodium-coupled anion symporter [Noviherbaspirillum sp. CPCC 100848]